MKRGFTQKQREYKFTPDHAMVVSHLISSVQIENSSNIQDQKGRTKEEEGKIALLHHLIIIYMNTYHISFAYTYIHTYHHIFNSTIAVRKTLLTDRSTHPLIPNTGWHIHDTRPEPIFETKKTGTQNEPIQIKTKNKMKIKRVK